MGKMITDIKLLPEATQKEIKHDIENRILLKARTVFENTPKEFSKYIEYEIKNAVKSMNDMIDESQEAGAIMQNISKIYVYNKERIAALKELLEETKNELKPQHRTEREIKYFTKAIEAGLMMEDNDRYKWLHSKASLGYFIYKVFDPKGTAQIPYTRMENLFDTPRLDNTIAQVLAAKKPQKWRNALDVLFDD